MNTILCEIKESSTSKRWPVELNQDTCILIDYFTGEILLDDDLSDSLSNIVSIDLWQGSLPNINDYI